MRRVEEIKLKVSPGRMVSGYYYLLDFPGREIRERYFLFRFHSIKSDKTVMCIGPYIGWGSPVNTFPSDEVMEFLNIKTPEKFIIRKYGKDIDLNSINYNDIII